MIPEFLISFDTEKLTSEDIDFLVVGGGIAGLTAAMKLKKFRTAVLYKNGLSETCTFNAQGGIASAISGKDSVEKHREDTLKTGCGIADPESVDVLVREGVDRIRELISSGLVFDRNKAGYHFTREGGHACRRILHIEGDSTGMGIAKFLYKKASSQKNIKIVHSYFLIDLISRGNKIAGALVYDENKKKFLVIRAKAFIIATGGAGNIFQETTNPAAITGDGIAAAYRCGAELADLEFFQFHPTTFYQAGAPRFLISESVRGEGGILRNSRGERFMSGYHPSGELAPRDIVTRAIIDQMKQTGSNCVYLDMKGMKFDLKKRFPTIYNFCRDYGINLKKDLVPVRPAAHYFMGGIKTDLWGKTRLENLYACGEAACTGVHGANRLASNSLLEGLVFGERTGRKALEMSGCRLTAIKKKYVFPQKTEILIDREDLKRSVRSLMWRNAGIEREGAVLQNTTDKLLDWTKYAFLKEFSDRTGFETLNMLIVSTLIVKAAYMRKESRGTHFRKDYPEQDDRNWKKHIIVARKKIFTA
ncbi:MAG: L-aspartate oxidase [Candidatus Omnitrophica bacterium]|nr:L-aspartate oxidase [Candidatus Omnitrophota bacterium]